MKASRLVALVSLVLAFSFSIAAQKFSYAAQKKFIPTELGQVYLGMPLKQFAAKIPLDGVEADGRFDWLELTVPFKKGNINSINIRIHGLSSEEKAAIVKKGKVKDKNLNGEEYERETDVVDVSKIPAKGFVYAMYIGFTDSFDLKKWTSTAYGKPGDIYKKGDNGYFYDHQWTRKTTDGLTWLIRAYFKDGNSLQLLGRIKGTEWDVNQ
ncbi:MAG TPA: hypothetical protein PKA82_02305 [Pyrinomonadaceae bacterium]|nr:hypothetical protein [Pyrinomonadaceae bacterium]